VYSGTSGWRQPDRRIQQDVPDRKNFSGGIVMNNSKTDVVMALSAGLASLLLFLVGIWDQG